jgi:hypothetical protein
MSDGAAARRTLLWAVFVAFCAVSIAYLPLAYAPVFRSITYYDAILLVTGVLGSAALLRFAGTVGHSATRTMCRIVLAYLLFEVLVVIPVAIWLGTASVNTILGTIAIRFTWLLFPVVLVICANDRARRAASLVVLAAAVGLVAWGIFSAATGGAGYYLEDGAMRFRVLYGGAISLFAWPFLLVLSRAVPGRLAAAFLFGASLVGLALTNMRSGFIAFAVAGLLCIAMSGHVRRLVPWILPAALIAAVVGLLASQKAGDAFAFTLLHLFDTSTVTGADRVVRSALAWDYFASRPFNDYVWSWRYYLVYLKDPFIVHNFVFDIAVTEGVAGLLFYGSVLTVPLRGAWKLARTDTIARALVGYVVFYCVFQLANANWYLPNSMPLLVAAVAALVVRVDQLRAVELPGDRVQEVAE